MVTIELNGKRADDGAINPTIQFTFEIEYDEDEIPIIYSGKLFAGGYRVAMLHIEPQSLKRDFKASEPDSPIGSGSHRIDATAELSDRAISHLKDERRRDEAKNLDLQVELKGKCILSNLTISSLRQGEAVESGVNIVRRKQPNRPGKNDMWIPSGTGSGTLLKVRDIDKKISVEISGNTWMYEYVPVFENKKVITIMYDIPLGGLPEELESAWQRLESAERKFQDHDDKGAASQCREAFNAIEQVEQEIRDVVEKNKWSDIRQSANSIKDFSQHEEDRGEDITRTDVEYVLNTMKNFVAYVAQNYPEQTA